MPPEAEEFTLDLRDGAGTFRMDCAVFGRGTRPMVLLPGISLKPVRGYGSETARAYRVFADGYRVCVPDRREDLPEDCTVRRMAADTAAAMRKLGIESADVLGISQGGMIAQYLAADYPELVRKLCLGLTISRPNETMREVVREWAGCAREGGAASVMRSLLRSMYSEEYARRCGRYLDALVGSMNLIEPERFARLAEISLSCEAYDLLDRITCPVFVIGAELDAVTTADASREIAEKLGCPLFIFQGYGHSVYEETEDFNRKVLDFFRDGR